MVGLGRRMPITTTAFLICGLSLIGLPLTAGFISKLYLARALLQADMIAVLVLVMASSALSVAYLWKIVEVLWQKGADTAPVRETPALYLPLWIQALANLWFGVSPPRTARATSSAATKVMIAPMGPAISRQLERTARNGTRIAVNRGAKIPTRRAVCGCINMA